MTDPASFRLLETLRWGAGEGFFLLDRHLSRLAYSAEHFHFLVDAARIREALAEQAKTFPAEPCRVRLLVGRAGDVQIDAVPLAVGVPGVSWRVGLATMPVDSRDEFLQHKTTARGVYERAWGGRTDVDDVILYNERGEVTESTRANVVIERGGVKVTPPVVCGLLPGTFREELLARGEIREAVISVRELREAPVVFLINSVREWVAWRWVGSCWVR